MTQQTCIGFTAHTTEMPTPRDMITAYHKCVEIAQDLGLRLTYFGASDEKLRGKYKKWEGRFHKRVIKEGMADRVDFSIAASPPGSEAPAYDSFFKLDLSFSRPTNCVNFALVVDEQYLAVEDKKCCEIVEEIASLWSWDYGSCFARDVASAPSTFLMGAISPRFGPNDVDQVHKWHESMFDFYDGVEPPRRLVMVRDVYPYNIVGKSHLDRLLTDARSLHSFVTTDPDCELRPITDELSLWSIGPDRVDAVRGKLLGEGVIICE